MMKSIIESKRTGDVNINQIFMQGKLFQDSLTLEIEKVKKSIVKSNFSDEFLKGYMEGLVKALKLFDR